MTFVVPVVYLNSPTPTNTTVARVSLAGAASTVPVNTDHTIYIKARKTSGTGLTVLYTALYEGATNRSGDLISSALTTTLAEYAFPITEAAAAAITDYSNLELRFWGQNLNTESTSIEISEIRVDVPALAGGTVTGSATLAGTGTLTASAQVEARGASTLAGVGTVSAVGQVWKLGAATLDGAGTLSATGTVTIPPVTGAATLSGTGTLAATAQAIHNAGSTLAGVGTVTPTAIVWRLGASTLAGVGTLTATAQAVYNASASISGIGTLIASAAIPETTKAKLGAYGGSSSTVTSIQNFEAWLGHPVKKSTFFPGSDTWNHIIGGSGVAYTYWGTGAGSAYRDKAEIAIHLLPSADPIDTAPTLALGAAGSYDSKWTTFANTLITKGFANTGDVVIRLGWEFTGSWTADTINVGGVADPTRAANYAAYWQRVVDICRAAFVTAGKPGVRWCWSPARDQVNPEGAYPGDSYVDVIGLSFYDSLGIGNWQDYVDEVYGITWQVSFANAHSKPLSISEWGLDSADNPQFVSDSFEFFLNNNYEYFCYFNAGNAVIADAGTTNFPNARVEYERFYGPGPTPRKLTADATSTDASSYTTALISPSANALILAAIHTRGPADSTDPPAPTLTGCGLTWTLHTSHIYDQAGTVHERLDIYRAKGSTPTFGTITIDLGGIVATAMAWTIEEFTEVSSSGTNGSGALGASATGGSTLTSPTTGSATLSGLTNAANGVYAVLGLQRNEVAVPGGGLVSLGHAENATPHSIMAAWEPGIDDPALDFAWTTGAAWGVIALELIAAPVGSATIQGQGSGAFTAQVIHNASSTLAGVGTVSATGNVTSPTPAVEGSATLNGVGTVSATGVVWKLGASTMAGLGTLAATGNEVYAGAATLTGLGTLAATARVEARAAATLAGAGTVSAVGQVWKLGATTMAGLGTLAATARVETNAAATLAGLGTLAASAQRQVNGTSTLAGVGTISTATGFIERRASVVLAGVGTATINSSLNRFGAATLSGVGILNAASQGDVPGNATLTGAGSLSALGSFTLFGSAAPYSALVIGDSPTSYWRLNEASGTVADDAVGANDGTYINTPTLGAPSLLTADNDAAVTLTAVALEQITLPGPSLSVNGAIEFWFKWSSGTQLFRDHTAANGWIVFDVSGTFSVRVGGTTISTSRTTAQVRNNSRHHLVISKTGADLAIYLDNVLIGSSAAVTNTASVNPWHVGANGSSGSAFVDATFDEIAIYPAALTVDQVAEHYLSGTTGSGLIGAGAMTATGQREVYGASTMAGAGTVTASGLVERRASATIVGVGTVTADAIVERRASATLAGVGTLAATSESTIQGSATLAGLGQLTSNVRVERNGSATIEGIGSLTVTGSKEIWGAALLEGVGSAQFRLPGQVHLNAATLRGWGLLSAKTPQTIKGVAFISSYGYITASGQAGGNPVKLLGQGNLTASGVVSSTILRSPRRVFPGRSSVRGSRVSGGVR